jgi:hypothetical protein
MLLEALAILSKLIGALDLVIMLTEIFALVDSRRRTKCSIELGRSVSVVELVNTGTV